jgi:hypothetical protein
MAKLVIRTGPQTGMEFPLDRPAIRLGRGSGSDIILQTSQASRQHAEISQHGDQFFIQDLGSTNGTFVNNEQVTAPRPLQPGDQVRIGDVVLAYELGAVGAAPAVATDWEAELWDDGFTEAGPEEGRKKLLLWGLVGVVAVLLVAVGVGAVFVLRGEATPTAVVVEATATTAITVAPTATQEQAEVQPTDTELVDVDVDVDVTVDPGAVEVPAPPVKPPPLPKPPPVDPSNLEQLPAMIQQFLGDVPPDQFAQVISSQIESLPPEQVQAMIGSLFPGVDQEQLPLVIAASFPELSESEIEALLAQVYPGQTFTLPQIGGPVGGRLALGIYDRDRDTSDLYLVDASGGQPTLLTEEASEPDVAPDGQWVVYDCWAADRKGLRLIRMDGTEDTTLTTSKNDSNPFFSPDGQRISFYNYEHKILHVINRDGSDRRDIGTGEYPAWSPTGNQIVYRGCIGGGKCGLIVANANGSNPMQITSHANDAAPRWSPNGGQIAFHSDRDGNWEVYVINSDGSWLRRITDHQATDVMPVWSPNGLRIAFRSDRGGQGAVWVTSGVGGLASKLLDADFKSSDLMQAQMDWYE